MRDAATYEVHATYPGLHGFDGAAMIAKSAMVASDIPMSHDLAISNDTPASGSMPGKCNGCAGDEKGLMAACSAFCSGVIAMPSASLMVYSVLVERLSPTTTPDLIGRSDPPDPYPPRPTVLS